MLPRPAGVAQPTPARRVSGVTARLLAGVGWRVADDPVLGPVVTLVLSAAGYVAFAELGYALMDASNGLASFWPSAGLIVGLLVRLPRKLLGWCIASVLPSEILIDSVHGAPLAAGLGWGAVDLTEVVLTAIALVVVARRLPRGDVSRDFFALAIVAFTVPALTGLGGGAVSHAVFGGGFFSAWWTWWLGDATGILLVVPLVLAVAHSPWVDRGWQWVVGLLSAGLMVAVAVSVFALTRDDVAFLVLPPLVLLAINGGLLLTAVTTVAFASIAAILTGAGHGPMSSIDGTDTRVLALDALIATTAFVGFLICASIAERRQAEDKATELAMLDPLTGLANRRMFMTQLELVTRRRLRSTEQAAILYCDLDSFKQVNDTFGHGAGDALLSEIGARLEGALRASDLAARVGGDEFAVLLEPVSDINGARHTARRIAEIVERPFSLGAVSVPVRVSVGIALVGANPEASLAQADADLYRVKQDASFRCLQLDAGQPTMARG